MDGIKRVNKGATTVHSSNVDHRRIQKSATLNRKFVKKPTSRLRITASAGAASKSVRQHGQQRRMDMIQRQNTVKLQPVAQKAQVAQAKAQPQQAQAKQQQQPQQQRVAAARKQIISEKKEVEKVQKNQTLEAAKARMAARKAAAQPEHLSAQELKDRAIKQALRKVERLDDDGTMGAQFNEATQQKQHFWKKRSFAISACMAVIAVALLGYLVALNMPDISVRVAAMQTGIEKLYPSYVPSNYRLDGLVKEEAGRVTMNFKREDGKKFILMEEKSSWDSAAVLSNYVKKNWGNDYSIAKGQGLTIYISGSNAAWVNGGVFYVITNEDGSLSATDLHDIAVSL